MVFERYCEEDGSLSIRTVREVTRGRHAVAVCALEGNGVRRCNYPATAADQMTPANLTAYAMSRF